MCIIHSRDASHFRHSGHKELFGERGRGGRRDYAYFMRSIGILMMQPEDVCLMILDYFCFYVFRGGIKSRKLSVFSGAGLNNFQ